MVQYEREFQIAALRCSDVDGSMNLSTSLAPGGWINVFIDPANEDNTKPAERGSTHFLSPNNKLGSVLSNGDSANSGGGSYSSDGEFSEGESDVPRPGPHTQTFAPPPVRRFHDISVSTSRSIYIQIWRCLQTACSDPSPQIALKAGLTIQSVHDKVTYIVFVVNLMFLL